MVSILQGKTVWFHLVLHVVHVFHLVSCTYFSFVFNATLLKYKFAIDEPEILADDTQCKITMSTLLAGCNIVFDETKLRLGSNKDASGPRSRTHINPRLNCGGSHHTRSSGHVTDGFVVTGAGEFLPPLILFSSSAENEANYAVKDEWVATFGKTKGKYGHARYVERLPYIAVRKSGSMDIRLFMEFVKNVTFDLYPEETVSLSVEIDEHGRLIKGPVMWTVDTGPGRLTSIDGEHAEEWEEWAREMMVKGVILNGLLPNSTTVSTIMDKLYRAFKIACRVSTHLVYARKIKANAKAIPRRMLAIAQKLARGEVVTEQERGKVTSIVSLNPGDLGDILYGRLSDDGFAAINSPIAKAFTKEKILEAHRKVRRLQILYD